jgi:hypothetical protein
MIAQTNKLQEKILDIKYGRIKEGLKIGVPEIDEHIRQKNNCNYLLIYFMGKTSQSKVLSME